MNESLREHGALSGKRVLVTRPQAQAGELESLLAEHGAISVTVPLIEFRPIADPATVDLIESEIGKAQWILFTSSNAIRYFFALLESDLPPTVKLASVGPRTQQTLQEFGHSADFVPSRYSSQGLIDEIEVQKGDRILYPSPKETNPNLVQSLQSAGATVTQVAVYETFPVKLAVGQLETLRSELDAVTFTSPSVVSSFCDQVAEYQSVLAKSVVACIGPMTAGRASELEIAVDVMPDRHTGPGLVTALVQHFENSEREKQ